MIKVLSIFGTRPEAIKMAPMVKELEKHPDEITSHVCVTAQHREMLDQVLDLFGIAPDYDLDLMEDDQSLSEITARVFTGLDPVIEKERPDWVLVQGDMMAASLVAFYHRVKVGHVEAGLRTHDKWQPFPEEVNRKVAGAVADAHFAPTATARDNLLREGVPDDHIVVTGNPVIDALLSVASRPAPSDVVQLLEEAGVSPCLPLSPSHPGDGPSARELRGAAEAHLPGPFGHREAV
jgi:UDP-N-acetylglucosamine 2-epimerase (non-hydrolysing)